MRRVENSKTEIPDRSRCLDENQNHYFVPISHLSGQKRTYDAQATLTLSMGFLNLTHRTFCLGSGAAGALAKERGVEENVVFHNRFVSPQEMASLVGSADIYVTPYRYEAQAVSGTLAYALGAGKAIISTPYCRTE